MHPGAEPNTRLQEHARSQCSPNNESTRHLINVLSASKLYREYERAFTEAIGVPLTFRAIESWQLPYHGKRGENPFCAVLAAKSRSCAACLRTTQRLSRWPRDSRQASPVPAFLKRPFRSVVGERLLGFLQTGQVFTRPPTESQFERTARLLQQWDVAVRREHLTPPIFALA